MADSFKLELMNDFTPVEVNEISALMRPQEKNTKSTRSTVVRNGAIIGMESPNIQITEISAADPTRTPGYRIVNQVGGGIRKKRIPK